MIECTAMTDWTAWHLGQITTPLQLQFLDKFNFKYWNVCMYISYELLVTLYQMLQVIWFKVWMKTHFSLEIFFFCMPWINVSTQMLPHIEWWFFLTAICLGQWFPDWGSLIQIKIFEVHSLENYLKVWFSNLKI
jgi:hypothetical protein